jgi:hypothetical protein
MLFLQAPTAGDAVSTTGDLERSMTGSAEAAILPAPEYRSQDPRLGRRQWPASILPLQPVIRL